MARPGYKHNFRFLKQLSLHSRDFTPQQRVFAEYLNANPESIGFLSIVEMSKRAGVSQATIVRFCNKIGYEGYSELNNEVRSSIQVQFGSVDRFKLGQLIGEGDKAGAQIDSIFSRMVSSEIENIYQLTRNIRVSDFRHCVDRVVKADRIAVIGSQASTSLVIHMFQMLSKILEQVDKITHHDIEAAAVIRRLTPESVAFVISFPRYARITLDIADALREKGVYIVVLTDNHLSPAIERSHMTFFIPVDVPSFVDGYASPIAFINALATEISMRHPAKSQRALRHYDEIVHKYKLLTQKRPEWQAIELKKNRQEKQLHPKR